MRELAGADAERLADVCIESSFVKSRMELQLSLPGDWPVGQYRRTPIEQPDPDDLESVLSWLQEVEINTWAQTTPPAHIAAGIHDPSSGEDIWDNLYPVEGVWPRGKIARWLYDTARFHYSRARP